MSVLSASLVIPERFWAKVDDSGDCHEWTAGTHTDGYGKFKYQGKTWGAHRFLWVATYGEPAPGLVVMHTCDNPPCVRLAHLTLGTIGDNMRDRTAKRRTALGEKNSHAKLTTEQVQQIRAMATGKYGECVLLAKMFGVTPCQISAIKLRRCWPLDG